MENVETVESVEINVSMFSLKIQNLNRHSVNKVSLVFNKIYRLFISTFASHLVRICNTILRRSKRVSLPISLQPSLPFSADDKFS